jgi:hypothetical protein
VNFLHTVNAGQISKFHQTKIEPFFTRRLSPTIKNLFLYKIVSKDRVHLATSNQPHILLFLFQLRVFTIIIWTRCENEEKTWDGAPLPPAAPPLPDLQQRGSWSVISGPASARGQHRARHRIRGWIPRCVKTSHCKKRISFFPSPAGMPQTKHSLDRNNLIIPGQGEFG